MIYVDVVAIYSNMTWGYTAVLSVLQNTYLKIGDVVIKSESEMWEIIGRDLGSPPDFTNYDNVAPDVWLISCILKPLKEGINLQVGCKLYK